MIADKNIKIQVILISETLNSDFLVRIIRVSLALEQLVPKFADLTKIRFPVKIFNAAAREIFKSIRTV